MIEYLKQEIKQRIEEDDAMQEEILEMKSKIYYLTNDIDQMKFIQIKITKTLDLGTYCAIKMNVIDYQSYKKTIKLINDNKNNYKWEMFMFIYLTPTAEKCKDKRAGKSK
ncbi:unnamed protein product [Didymodactylos carnosus]|uniref:Uncharacterized protein n=1 Tax=Didymodactylos carnosus TaxID=1234261 RepID=A0A814FLW6_9BILA|nr:unnamed protein product [Didymodactylos carnosus]CAF0985349.1 unnamed protein product [Didymodactylos carnosus]CAF3551732.1 unnamed protein product [Didymodactylos carnosus]CAF3757606.1 unnamed protein product [Didymodactylos carnosus]